ncbi:MAG: TetR/AcrR family transcriptional regulator [Thermomicrobiales bacterium]
MARYPKEQKAQTREQILTAASQAFREQGIAEVSIPALMGKLGLTHGGFYAHFPSKDALAAEASIRPLQKRSAELAQMTPGPEAVQQVIAAYISPQKRDNPADSCPLPSLSGELSRANPEVRHTYTEALRTYLDRIGDLLPPAVAERAPDQELALVASMVGAVLLARAVDDPDLSDRILAATREFATSAFANAENTATPVTCEG